MRKMSVNKTEHLCVSELQKHLIDLANCEYGADLLNLLRSVFESRLKYTDCIIINRYKYRYYETIATTNDQFSNKMWSECSLFTQTAEHGYAICQYPQQIEELEFSILYSIQTLKLKNSLLFSVNTQFDKGIFIFTNVDAQQCEQLVNSDTIKILLQQAFFTLISQIKLAKQTDKALSLIHKFTTLSSLFKEYGSEWFWRLNPLMVFESINNIETIGNVYDQLFIGHKIEHIITDNEKQNTEKWQQFNQLIDDRNDFHNFELEIEADKNFWVILSGKPLYNKLGHFLGYMGLAKNITISKQREFELQAQTLKAEEASQTKSKFLSVMSHEIRTPIHAVMGMIELLLNTELSPEQQQLVNYANSSTEILYGLITDVLDFSKIESGTVSCLKKPFDIKLLTENIVGQFNIIEKSDDILFTTHIDESIPQYVVGDQYRLGQVLFNIMSNAFKYTTHGQINLNVVLQNEQLVFEVKDSGIGIAKKHLDLIFKPFSQVNDSINRKSEGVGLGLSISKNLLGIMGGDITVDTQLGLGSTFTISIPFEEAHTSDIVDNVIYTQSALAILVAEDNKTNQVLIKAYLEKLNHKVTLANHGREAIDLFSRKKFDLVLMDIMMPEMDGLTAAEYIRDELVSDVPIYALTANAEKDNKASCFKVGMNKVLTKPIKFQELEAALKGVFPR